MERMRPGSMILGTGLVFTGGWLIATEAGLPLIGLDRLWPVLLMVAGAALLADWTGHRNRPHRAVLFGCILILSGLFLTLFTLEVGNLTWAGMKGYWPVFLLIVGVAYLIVYLQGDIRKQALLLPVYGFGISGALALLGTLGLAPGAAFNQVLRLSPLLLVLAAFAVYMRFRASQSHETLDTEVPE